jgi:hypothetical protein
MKAILSPEQYQKLQAIRQRTMFYDFAMQPNPPDGL